jgi:DNA-directed RNA polymerase specialized sigma24 family protein
MQTKEVRLDALSNGRLSHVLLANDLITDVYRSLYRFWVKRGLPFWAEDLAQEGVIKGWLNAYKWEAKQSPKGTKPASLKTFLVRVGINEGTDRLRTLLRREERMRYVEMIVQRAFEDRRPARSQRKTVDY